MKNLIIIGAGGFGLGVYEVAQESVGYKTDFTIKGFLDTNSHALDEVQNCPPVLGNEDDYAIEPNDVFVCALGNLDRKKSSVIKMLGRGAEFINLISNKANVSPYAEIGRGNIVLPYAGIAAKAKVGDFNLFQARSIISHDCVVGSFNRFDCYVVCVGGVQIENEVTVHTSAVINHRVVLKNNSTVGALSFVVRNVQEGTTVIGNPAKRIVF